MFGATIQPPATISVFMGCHDDEEEREEGGRVQGTVIDCQVPAIASIDPWMI